MSQNIRKEIANLKKMISSLAAAVEEGVNSAVAALETRDRELAQRIIDGDIVIDRMEVDVEEECLKVLALYQPVAIDLRLIVAIMKINSDLERIGDLSVNIAERAAYLAGQEVPPVDLDYPRMEEAVREMLRRSLDALTDEDAELAHTVFASDDEVDAMNREMYVKIQEAIGRYPDKVECLIHLLSVSRHLERIGDHATNIAEEVIYMIEGEIVRHKSEDYSSGQ